jgi:uncharacterized caspase-like protein/tetratricopeptide (TPR) repeat protein
MSWLTMGLVLFGTLPAPAMPAAPPDSRRIERVEGKTNVVAGSGRWAIVVGVDKYISKDIPSLGGAVADAKAVSAALIKYADFPAAQVFTMTTDGANKPTAEAVLQKLSDIKASAKPDDLVLFFFAGHGVEVEGQRFLLTQDAKISSSAALKLSSLSVNLLIQEIENLPLAHRIVMVDACRDDPLSKARRVASDSFATAFILKPGNERGVRATFLSCKSGQSAYEWTEKGRGFFSYYIEKGLQGEAAQFGKVTVSSLETYLNEMVPQAVREQKGKEQTPFVDRSGEALVLVTADKIAPSTQQPPAAAVLAMRRVYGVIKNGDGAPVTGANVQIAWALSGARSTGKPANKQETKVVTDEDGFFTVEVPADADAEVNVQAAGYQPQSKTSSPRDAGGKIKLFLASRGGVTDSGKRVAEATAAPTALPTAVPTKAPRAAATSAAKAATATPVPPTPVPTAVPTASPVKLAGEQAKAAYQAFLVEDFKQAETSARDALRLDKDNPLALSVLAGALAVEGVNQQKTDKVSEADETAARALKLDANQALAHNAKGLVQWSKKELDAAQREFEKASSLDSRLGAANTNLAYLQFQKKLYKEAEKSYRSAIKANPESAVPYNGLAQVLLEQNKAGDAAKASREAISKYELRDPYLGAFYVNLAVALYQQRKQDEALEAVARARGLGVKTNPAYEVIEKGPGKSK